jgi:hypothetical protein
MSSNAYDKMADFIESIYHVALMVNRKAVSQQDSRLRYIALTIWNYLQALAVEHGVDVKALLADPTQINLIPIFEYVAANNIEFYDFSTISPTDVDVSKKSDIERFVLSHIYYITQGK